MQGFRRIMVGLSRQPADNGTIRYAAMVATLCGAQEVRFVHVLPQSAASDSPSKRAKVEADLRQAVAAETRARLASMAVHFEVPQGPLTDQLLTLAAQSHSDLMIVGHSAGHSGHRALARRLAMKAPCSVWMVPENSSSQMSHILVPVDFSEHSADTMRVAVSLARASGATCTALHVYFNTAVATYEEYDQVLRGEEQQSYEKFISSIDTQDVAITPLFEECSQVPHVILRVAKRLQADLIVMGTRGRSRSAAILLGSVTEQTIIAMPVPLLAVKHFGARIGVLQALLDRTFDFGSGLHTD